MRPRATVLVVLPARRSHLPVPLLVLPDLSVLFFFFSSRRRHTRFDCDWSSRRVLFRSGRAGELELGTTRLQESLDAYLSSGARLNLPHFYVLLADLRLAAGDRPRALDALRAGEEHIEIGRASCRERV